MAKRKVKNKYNQSDIIDILRSKNGTNNPLGELSTYDGHTSANELLDTSDIYDEDPFVNTIARGTIGRDTILNEVQKRQAALDLIKNPEIDDIVDILMDELIVFEKDTNYFCRPNTKQIDLLNIDDNSKELLKSEFEKAFEKIYSMLNFDSSIITGVDDVRKTIKKWLAIGSMAWYIVYDDVKKPTKIIDIRQLDLMKGSLVPLFKKERQPDGSIIKTLYWQFLENTNARNVNSYGVNTASSRTQTFEPIFILDAQLIHINWSDIDISDEFSYVSRLERSFNRLRTIEKAHMTWLVTNSRDVKMFIVPIKGKGKVRGAQALQQSMNKYREDFTYDEVTGKLSINGDSQYTMSNQIWIGETASGTPQVEQMQSTGIDLSDTSVMTQYQRKLYQDSKIPMSKFEDGGERAWAADTDSISRDERRLGKYIQSVRRALLPILLKPIYFEISLQNPQFGFSDAVFKSLGINFGTHDQFNKMMELELLLKNAEAFSTLRQSLTKFGIDGEEEPILANEFLLQKIGMFSEADLKLNEELLEKEINEKREKLEEIRRQEAEAEMGEFE